MAITMMTSGTINIILAIIIVTVIDIVIIIITIIILPFCVFEAFANLHHKNSFIRSEEARYQLWQAEIRLQNYRHQQFVLRISLFRIVDNTTYD